MDDVSQLAGQWRGKSARSPVRPGPDHRLSLTAACVWGACAVVWLRPGWWMALTALTVVVAIAGLWALAAKPHGKHVLVGPRLAAAILLGACGALVGAVHTHLVTQAEHQHPLVLAPLTGRTLTMEGSVCAWPAPTRFGWRVEVCLERIETRSLDGTSRWEGSGARVQVRSTHSDWGQVSLGQRIRFSGTRKDVARHERALVQIKARRAPMVLDSPSAVEWRRRATTAVRSRATSPLVAGLGWGQRTDLPPQMSANMRATSLTHLTAVSGAHLAIVVGLVGGLAGGPRWLRLTLTGLCTAGFVWLVGPSASVMRSATMVAIGIGALATNRAVTTAGALWLTATGMILIDPHNALDYSFALSFLATAGIVLVSPRIAQPLSRRLPRWLSLALAVPLAAQVTTLPVTVMLNPSLPLYSVPANLLAGVAVGPGTVAALLALGAAGSAWDTPLVWLADALAGWIAGVAAFFAHLPGASLP